MGDVGCGPCVYVCVCVEEEKAKEETGSERREETRNLGWMDRRNDNNENKSGKGGRRRRGDRNCFPNGEARKRR